MTIFSSLQAARSFGFHFFSWTGEVSLAIVRKSFSREGKSYFVCALAHVKEEEK